MIYITRPIRRYKYCPDVKGQVFYLGGTDPQEADEFMFSTRLDEHAGACGTAPRLYYEIPEWLRAVVKSHAVKEVSLSEFDRLTCSHRGGIPSVQLGLSFSDEVA
jgi:hypothetical protein